MGIAVVVWQLFIILTIWISGKNKKWVAAFWVIWTLVQVFALPLSILQYGSIWLGYKLAGTKTE
jgi:DNA helicase-4